MEDLDSVLRGRPSEQEATRPRWVPLRPDLFPFGTVGYSWLAASFGLLKGRERPETVFDQPLVKQSRWSSIPTELQEHGLSSARDILRLPENEFTALFRNRTDIQKKLDEFISALASTPHARLLDAVFGGEQEAVAPDVERELMQTVEAQLATLPTRQQDVLIARFGLYDGIARSLEEVEKLPQFGVTKERIHQIKAEALRILRRPSRSRHLKACLQFPQGSLGRRIFGNAVRKDLPSLEISTGDLGLSEAVMQELDTNWLWFPGHQVFIDSLTRMAVSEFSPEAVSEIASALWRHVAGQQETQAPEETDVFVAPPAQEQISESLVNNLLPGLIPAEKLAAVAGIRIDHLDLDRKLKGILQRNIATVGDVFRLTGQEFGTMRNMGPTYAQQLGKKLEELLELPQSAYQKGLIPLLLVRALAGLKQHYSSYRRSSQGIPQEHDSMAMQRAELQTIVQSFTQQGITDPAEIQRRLVEQDQRLLGEYADSLKSRALIEYALNHPEEL